jgi:hypothetical protein
MFVRLTKGLFLLDLAGGNGASSESSGFRISPEPVFQKADFIEADEAVQYFRGGVLTSMSFDSRLAFESVQAAESYLLATPQGILNQSGQTVTVGRITAAGTKQIETLTCLGTATLDGNLNWSFVAADVGTITGAAAILNLDTPTLYAAKLTTSLNANATLQSRYLITTSGADVIITKRQYEANDGTLALTTTNGSPNPGVTGVTSANTTSGIAPTVTNSKTFSNVSLILSLAQQGVSIMQNVSLLGKYS